MWKKVTEDEPEQATTFQGYSPEWIDADFNPEGVRETLVLDIGKDRFFMSANWNGYTDQWDTDQKTKPTHWRERPKPPGAEGEEAESLCSICVKHDLCAIAKRDGITAIACNWFGPKKEGP